uniref:Immunoglobulin V-set domain-containing protein n=1 Tax=Acanthochromis polyacanthus TaxID=80966 RepID=A0A3Q1ESQ0_9TELE
MWRSLFFHTAALCLEASKVLEVSGQTFDFRCEYPSSLQNCAKYFYRGDDKDSNNHLIRTEKHNQWERDGRFSLFDIRDNKRIKYFYMYINDLNEADSGTYWCGSGRTMQPDDYTKVHLSVGEYSNVLLQIEHILVRNSQQASGDPSEQMIIWRRPHTPSLLISCKHSLSHRVLQCCHHEMLEAESQQVHYTVSADISSLIHTVAVCMLTPLGIL